ncbi:MAG: hypothetical protein HQ503_08380 [Rhodospirillales bacterium]|nr:hypothetical protein [Rhodospirillales bacterium]
MIGFTGIGFSPLVDWRIVAAVGGIVLVLALFGLIRGARGSILRMFAAAILSLALLNPHLEAENRRGEPDVALIMVDQSSSQNNGERRAQLASALEKLRADLGKLDDLQLRVVHGTETEDGTQLFGELDRAVADIPAGRFAGAILLSDGQVHDVPNIGRKEVREKDKRQGIYGAPIHALLTGRPNEKDRRLVVEQAPAYGIVGKSVKLRLKIEDHPKGRAASAGVTVRIDGGEAFTRPLPTNEAGEIEIPIEHGGQTIIELEVQAMRDEMSLINNRAVVSINGVRDRLRVLLVSGQPHLGERTWRNLLKSDPSVDLVHFTILRPPEKNDFTPLNELALISFPIRELFEIKLHEFDLIVFDRYVVRFVLPPNYFKNIADYVEKGGAVLAAFGPDFAGLRSMFHTPLGRILPGAPLGPVFEGAFRAQLTDKGKRHPVTSSLQTADGKTPNWGRWYRQIDAEARRGTTLLDGAGQKPLLILERFGKGRVAQFMSDHVWLWARGHDDGGPYAELMRRLAHWLMKEPDLEEEDLRAAVDGRSLKITRRSLENEIPPVTVTQPSGASQTIILKPDGRGSAQATLTVEETGLYRIEDGVRRTMAAVGKLNPIELSDLRASPEKLMPVIRANGGGVAWISEGIPGIRRIKPGRGGAGRGWLGLVQNGAYVVTGVRQIPLLPALLFLLLAAGSVMFAWWREGK